MNRTLLISALLVYTVIAGGVTVIPLAYVYGRAIVLLLIASALIFSVLHGRTGGGPTMMMEGGGGETDYTEIDAAPSQITQTTSLPRDGRTALTFYLLGLVLWSLGATVVLTLM